MSSKTNTIQVAEQLFQQIEAMSEHDRRTLGEFVRKLQQSPLSLLQEAQAKGDFFASRLFKDSYLYWSLEIPDNLSLTSPLHI